MRSFQLLVFVLVSVLLASSPESIWAKEGEIVYSGNDSRAKSVESKTVGERIRDIADWIAEKATARLILKKLAGVLEPIELGNGTLSSEQTVELEQPAPSAGVAPESKPAPTSPATSQASYCDQKGSTCL